MDTYANFGALALYQLGLLFLNIKHFVQRWRSEHGQIWTKVMFLSRSPNLMHIASSFQSQKYLSRKCPTPLEVCSKQKNLSGHDLA